MVELITLFEQLIVLQTRNENVYKFYKYNRLKILYEIGREYNKNLTTFVYASFWNDLKS